ncbi:MAG: hypothetical protein KAU48_08905 [Candidatus Thorarchaeota archaeon]|nr:hypothetical protein [Candidatus Thorarchaeota archaeon]
MGSPLKRTRLADVSGLTDEIQVRLKGIGITTAELLAASVPEEIMSRIGIRRDMSLELIKSARKTIGVGGFKRGLELEAESTPHLGTGIGCVDRVLEGGLRSGTIIEMRGPQWAGKTLMCSHLAIMAQLIETDDGTVPKVIWYDAEQSYRKKRIKEIAFRLRLDPEEISKNIILVDIVKSGIMESSFETIRKTLAKHHVSLVIVDPLPIAMKHLETPFTLTGYVSNMSKLARATGTTFIISSRTRFGFSRGVVQEYKQRGSLSMMIDYGFHFHLKGERERNVVLTDAHGTIDTNCKLYIGPGGFFDDSASRNLAVRRVERFLRRI